MRSENIFDFMKKKTFIDLPAPSDLQAESIGETEITVTWSDMRFRQHNSNDVLKYRLSLLLNLLTFKNYFVFISVNK